MPTYEYICNNADCLHDFEIFQSMKDDALTICPLCNQPTLRRKIGSGAGIIFKGSGFYETDYKRNSGKGSSSKSSDSVPSPKNEKTKETSSPADS
jgi:putative FmdB family regulatory protein